MDLVTHLEHLEIVLKEVNLIDTTNKNILIWYFQDSLRFSIKA